MKCYNCQTEIDQRFCPNCGRPAHLERINFHYIVHELTHLLHFEKGISYTIKALLLRPGKTIREFLHTDRSRLVKPVVFIIVTSVLYTVLAHALHFEESVESTSTPGLSPTTGLLMAWVQNHYGYANMIMGCIIALWLQLFFLAYRYTIFETLIALCFTMGMGMLMYSVLGCLQALVHVPLIIYGGWIAIAYSAWALGQWYDGSKWHTYARVLLAYLLGMTFMYVMIAIIGTVVDVAFHRN
jgi:Protein of unknown function (DUF3667)